MSLFEYGSARWMPALAASLLFLDTAFAQTRPAGQLYYNNDCTDFFWTSQVPAGKAGETIDRYVDVVAGAGVTVFLCNTNARRTNYQSRAWDAFWDGYDPAGPDDQPFLKSIPRPEVAEYRKGISNMLAVHQQGVDYPDRVIQRCRHHGISPWITLRMNDCHCNDIPDHPFHGSFWKENPQFRRQNCSGYFATCLDYARPEVRAYYMALIDETLDRYDIDGLELDFMREPYLFSAGKETEEAPILTGWIRDVRKKVEEAASRRGHRIRLGVRVPSRPEVAAAMGLDVIEWAKEGLIDLLVATPRWETLEFDLPISRWRQMLGRTNVTLAGGLEVLYRSFPGCRPVEVSPELAHGAATSLLSQGVDTVYLFNYFPINFPQPVYQDTIKAMASLDALRKLPRRFGVTYRDITAPGEAYRPPLPATGKSLAFTMRLGPKPDDRWTCEVLVGLAATPDVPISIPSASVDDIRCEYLNKSPVKGGLCLITFRMPVAAMKESDLHEIKFVSDDSGDMTIQKVEVSLRPPDEPTVKRDTRPASQKTTLPDVQILWDLEYIKNGHERNRLDLYLPEKATRPMPVIVWVHGGGWQRGDKTRCPAIPFTAKGYAVAAINYRFSQHAVFPAQIHDCKAAIRWLRANAGKYGLDPNHIGAGGGSAGGHLVALLGTTAGVKEFEGPGGNEDQSSRVQAVVDWYGPSDFLTVGPKETRTRLIGGDPLENREKAIKASPITYVSKDSAPFLIMHGDKDKTVPISQSETLARALEKAGAEVTFLAIKGAGHGGRLFTSPENMKQVEDFFDRHLARRQSQGGRE